MKKEGYGLLYACSFVLLVPFNGLNHAAKQESGKGEKEFLAIGEKSFLAVLDPYITTLWPLALLLLFNLNKRGSIALVTARRKGKVANSGIGSESRLQ